MRPRWLVLMAPVLAMTVPAAPVGSVAVETRSLELHVDPRKGDDAHDGTVKAPLKTISAALARLPEPLEDDAAIRLAPGKYTTTGGRRMSNTTLQLSHRMRPGVRVTFEGPAGDRPAILAWRGERMIDVEEGRWRCERLQIGTFEKGQKRGLQVRGCARVGLRDVTFRLRSGSDVAVRAEDGGHVYLRGAIRVNEDLFEKAGEQSFSGLLAVDHGVIEFDEHDGSTLEMGNGSLSARTYGRIRLGCESARITSWTDSNCLSIANSGRIDLGGTPTTLRAVRKNNTAIGLEHDGHVLAEDAHVRILGPNDSAIALQKVSSFTCNDVELVGEFEFGLWATSGSLFVGRFLTDVPKLDARTGARICVEAIDGEVGEVVVKSGGLVSLPGRVVRSE